MPLTLFKVGSELQENDHEGGTYTSEVVPELCASGQNGKPQISNASPFIIKNFDSDQIRILGNAKCLSCGSPTVSGLTCD